MHLPLSCGAGEGACLVSRAKGAPPASETGVENSKAAARFSSEPLKTSFNLPRFRGRALSSAVGRQALFPGKAGLLSHLLFEG